MVCSAPWQGSVPLHRMNLARGGRQLIVIPDEGALDLWSEEWARLGRTVRFAHLGLSGSAVAPRYRAPASIVMAEVARQVGRTAPSTRPGAARGPRYDRVLDLLCATDGVDVPFADLLAF